MTHDEFIAKTPTVNDITLASCLLRTATMLKNLEIQNNINDSVASIVVAEAARRLSEKNTSVKLIEDLAKRVFDTITPENVALGHTWLRRKLTQVIAAN